MKYTVTYYKECRNIQKKHPQYVKKAAFVTANSPESAKEIAQAMLGKKTEIVKIA